MFLTLEDPRAKVQGSRDPLGVQPVWASFGRKLVTNLTTVSNSVRGFTIVLLGRYYAERLIEEGRARDEDALPIFIRMEQIGAYARFVGHGVESEIRGIERVKRFLSQGTRVTIQDSHNGHILSDQKVYGLWGLFSVSARVSGLITDGPVGLTSYARSFVESEYVRKLAKVESELTRLLLKGGALDTSPRNPLFKVVAGILTNEFTQTENAFYAETLRDAERNPLKDTGRQAALADLLAKHTKLTAQTGRADIERLQRAARRVDEGLASRLGKVGRLEALLAPAEALFGHLQVRNGQRLDDLAEGIVDHWGKAVPNLGDGFENLEAEIRGIVGAGLTNLMKRCDGALAVGDYKEAIMALLKWNELVMKARKAAPWVRVGSGGKLEVRYRGLEGRLPDGDELPALWRNSYFLDSLKDVTFQLAAVV